MDRFVRLALPDVSMHRLRHHFASALYANDADLFVLQDILGHASPETPRIYARVTTEHTRAAIAKLPDFGAADTPAAVGDLVARFAPRPAAQPVERPVAPACCAQCGQPLVSTPYCPAKRFCSVACGVKYRRAKRRQKGNEE